jgi:hypothetical protein
MSDMSIARIWLIILSLCFAGVNFYETRYELRHSKNLIISSKTRAYLKLFIGSQWFVTVLIYAFGWDTIVNSVEVGEKIFGTLILILVGVPLLLQYLEWVVYHIRESRKQKLASYKKTSKS